MVFWKSLSAVVVAVALALATMLLSACGLMRGSDYPSTDITFIVPFNPGGSADPVARAIQQAVEPMLKVKLNIVNKPGAVATIGTTEVVQSKPDGYTLGLGSTTAVVTQPHVMQLPYAGPDTYQPLVLLTEHQDLLAVRAESPYKTFEDWIADVKKRPGGVTVGTPGVLNDPDMELMEFEKRYGFQLTHVPFTTGGAESLAALLGGKVDCATTTPVAILPQVQAGKVRILATFFEPQPQFPGVKSMAEMGYKFSKVGGLYFMMGPKGMDKAVIDKLVTLFTDGAKTASFQKFASDNGYFSVPTGPDALGKRLKEMLDNNGKLINEFNLKPKQ